MLGSSSLMGVTFGKEILMPSIMLLLAVIALVFTILDITGKLPLWAAVLILCIIALLQAGTALR